MYTFASNDAILVGMLKEVKKNGVNISRRANSAGAEVRELPYPIIIELTNPLNREITIPERKWNWFLPFSESLWIARGDNDLMNGPGYYVKSLFDFSDDGRTWRGGYGPRIRSHSGRDPITQQYAGLSKGDFVDQLRYVVELLKKDPLSRQATITIADPMADLTVEKTKDYPCTRELQFQVINGKLNMYTYMRSNDALWGNSLNIWNFTFLQEYVGYLTKLPLGRYYHSVTNFHYYLDQEAKIDAVINTQADYTKIAHHAQSNPYAPEFASFDAFNDALDKLRKAELDFQKGNFTLSEDHQEQSAFFSDWEKAFLVKNLMGMIRACEKEDKPYDKYLDMLKNIRFKQTQLYYIQNAIQEFVNGR